MIMKIIKALWIGATVLVIAITLYAFDGTSDSDIGIFFAWCMLALAFPGGLLIPLVHVVLYDGLSIMVMTSYLSFVLDWAGFFVLGYLQWFMLLPWLWRKWKGRRASSAARSV